jgi:hypothetical protein
MMERDRGGFDLKNWNNNEKINLCATMLAAVLAPRVRQLGLPMAC